MRKSGVLPAVLALGALMVATPAASQETTVADVGRGFFHQYCSGCHGLEGKGDGAFIPYLKAPPPDLTTIAKRRGGNFPETELLEMIDGRRPFPAHGTRDMPIWGERFAPLATAPQATQASIRGQVILLVAYLRSIQQK